MGSKTKIDWADSTWNPVTGCLHGCKYCYAEKQAHRFGGFDHDENKEPIGIQLAIGVQELDKPKYIMRGNGLQKAPYPWFFTPTFHRHRLDEPQHWKKPHSIFVCSMADLFGEWAPDEWIQEVFKACDNAAQHRYLFLTKNPSRYKELGNLLPAHRRPPAVAEMWFGHSYTGIGAYRPIPLPLVYSRFVSIEPLLHSLSEQDMMVVASTNDWIIIGAETGSRKGKVTPDKSWVDGIAYYAKRNNVPVFMKESLREIMGADFRQEFPWEAQR